MDLWQDDISAAEQKMELQPDWGSAGGRGSGDDWCLRYLTPEQF